MPSRDVLDYLCAVGKCLRGRGWAKEANVFITAIGEKWCEEGIFGFIRKLPDIFHNIGKLLT